MTDTNLIIPEFSMYITKSTKSDDGTMRWSAVNSDVDWDLYGERMTIQLYKGMLGKISRDEPPPHEFKELVCSDYWCGGMPYLSIAHYPDLNGFAVPGQPLKLYIDGKQLKAKGVLFDTPLGRAVWNSLKKDELNFKNKTETNEDRIRISIAFLDLMHKHGEDGTPFKRESLHSICPECLKGIGDKIYLDGYLVHLALTRVPVNPRTIMQAEDIMPKKSIKTRKEDAESIVGEEEKRLVTEIDQLALNSKSEALVEMSDTESTPEDEIVEVVKAGYSDKEDEEEMDDEMSEEMKDKKHMKEKSSLPNDEEISIKKADFEKLVMDTVEKVLQSKSEPTSRPESPVKEKSALEVATEGLYASVQSAISLPGTLEEKLQSINPALQEMGNVISVLVRDSVGVSAPTPVANDQSAVLEAIQNLANELRGVSTEVATMKARIESAPVNVQSRVPAPRSITPVQPVVPSQTPVNPRSVDNIARRSVSPNLPLK